MDDYDIRFVNGNTITYVRRDTDAVDFGEEDDCCVSAIEAVQYHNDATTLADGHYAVGSDTYRVDDLWVIDGVSADRTNQYGADSGEEWKLEIWDDNCTWDSAITTDRSNADAVNTDEWNRTYLGRINGASTYRRNTFADRIREIYGRTTQEDNELYDEHGGILDEFLGEFSEKKECE